MRDIELQFGFLFEFACSSLAKSYPLSLVLYQWVTSLAGKPSSSLFISNRDAW
jgi:hypothetical protein